MDKMPYIFPSTLKDKIKLSETKNPTLVPSDNFPTYL